MNYSNCCHAETPLEEGELLQCPTCKEWATAESESESKLAPCLFTVFLIVAAVLLIAGWFII